MAPRSMEIKLGALLKRVDDTLTSNLTGYLDPLRVHDLFATYDRLRRSIVETDSEYYGDVPVVETPTPAGDFYDGRGGVKRADLVHLFNSLKYLVRLHRRDSTSPMQEAKRVFVAYGHNDKARAAMFTFLRALGLAPMEWDQMYALTASTSATNSQVVGTGMDLAAAYVILLTPDEQVVGKTKSNKDAADNSRTQARPNVLAELGMSWSKDPTRTVIVTLGNATPPSNFDGKQRVQMDDTPAQRRRLATALKVAGCPVDESGVDWLGTLAGGDFDAALADDREGSPSGAPAATTLRAIQRAKKGVQLFTAWCQRHGRDKSPDTDTLLYWVEHQAIDALDPFDYGDLRRIAEALPAKGYDQICVPEEREFLAAHERWSAGPREDGDS